ncbi:thioredoxin family protein [Pedosphaera parvula]|uniref:Thioredoxin n=1 Tax=Pedosphaera parvula (strain Ellin514) TaxID=320771 RepID=B9XLS4_PEDPL|nr:thioredoxin family protein [Pedosphaera parvula]EEF59181.1 Thioredoxin domain protein [Pedosphaera parvula Ellin514]
MATLVTSANFESEVLKHSGRVLVDFYTDSCSPCRYMNPIIDELAMDRPNLKIVKIDAAEDAELGAQFRVMGVPTFLLFDNGQVQKQITGSRSKKEFAAWLDT